MKEFYEQLGLDYSEILDRSIDVNQVRAALNRARKQRQ